MRAFWAVCSLAVAIAGQIYWTSSYTAGLDSMIDGLAQNSLRLAERLSSLERDRDRLPKLEERFGRIKEKMSMMIELQRETRQERQGPMERGG
ncbi:hypothetical protein CHKEEEPN_4300 [Methylorubrum podarium]|nr:hypothetical protein CHKEEEPN_4300 [Methylorubrum podarium]